MSITRWIAAMAALVSLSACVTPPATPRPHEHLAYQIIVTAPGTRSQGWRGVLYDRDDSMIGGAPGAVVEVEAGRFVSVPCPYPWSTCGMIREEMAAWMRSHDHNINMREAWTYRLYQRGETWRGALLRDGAAAAPRESPVTTPMGRYLWRDGAGWAHESEAPR